MSSESSDDETVDRREFLKVGGTISVAAASWLALTQKTDALAQNAPATMLGEGAGDHNNYDYDHPNHG